MRKNVLRNERGFTLIEIITVLIILGILASIGIPKYLGIVDDAELAVAKGAVSELNGRVSLAYAKKLIRDGSADGSDANGYVGFNSHLGDWDGTIKLAEPIKGLKRRGGKLTFGATWNPGDNESPGYWSNTAKESGGQTTPQ